jgi:hypothetical protein
MFETVERKRTQREWWGMIFGLRVPIPGWEIALRLIGVVSAVIVCWACARYLFFGSPVLSPWLVWLPLTVLVGIGAGLQWKHSGGRRASRGHH